jgi:mono/diheme cytochrome c family protein
MKMGVKGFLFLFSAACSAGRTDSTDGKRMFDEVCGRCRGTDGKGVPAIKASLGVPDMTDPDWQAKHADADIKRTVHEGSKSKKMPPFGDNYSGAQLDRIISHIRSFPDKK